MPNYRYAIDSKLPRAGTSIFAVMSRLAAEEGAINLSQGYPDFPSSPQLIELVCRAMKEGYNQYAPMPGINELREAISGKIESLYHRRYDPETEITVTAGATQAIFTAISAMVRSGDEVILFAPAYDCYGPAVRANGGRVVELELAPPEYRVNWNAVRAAISPRTRMILINTPHNPTGTIWTRDDMEQLEDVVSGTDIVILSDEVYEHLVYDGLEHCSAAVFSGLAERSFVVASFGKTFHNTGWKMGYVVGPKELMQEFRKIHQFNVFSVNHPMQKALATYLKDPENYLYLPDFFQKKRDLFLGALEGSEFEFRPSSGTYFQLLGYSRISSLKDTELARQLTVHNKVASIPVSVFYESGTDHKVLRFCFAKSDETILKGAEILKQLQALP